MRPNDHALDHYRRSLDRIFSSADRYKGHSEARTLLKEMAEDHDILLEIIRRSIKKSGFFSQPRINPVIALNIFETEQYTLVANCWIPLPGRETTTSHQSIHHHGPLLLTSASAYGDGYESILFKKGFYVEESTNIAQMEVDKIYSNPKGYIEFVDAFTPHVVFYPKTFTVTYALWSQNKTQSLGWLKKIEIIKKHKKTLSKALNSLGLGSYLGVNKVMNYDFYAKDGRIIQMKDRRTYPSGSSENFLHNFFYVLQQVGFHEEDKLRQAQAIAEPKAAHQMQGLIESLLTGKEIPDQFEPIHLNIDRVNLYKTDILNCFHPKYLERMDTRNSMAPQPL